MSHHHAERTTAARSDDRAGALAEHDDAALADVVPLLVGGVVHTDPRPGRHDGVLVEDGPPHVGALADVDAVHQHAVLDPRAALDPDAGWDDRVVHRAAADDRAGAHHRLLGAAPE